MYKAPTNSGDLKLRLKYQNKGTEKLILNYITRNTNSDKELKEELSLIRKKKNFLISKSKIVNHCIYSGRVRGTLSYLRLSRLVFKKFSSFGLVYPYKRVSW